VSERRIRPVLCVLACALADVLAAQATAERRPPGELATPDGSRFVLVSTGGPPLVHWVMITPAGALEDPAGLEGLSHAVARAAALGTTFAGSRDSDAEWQLLERQDLLERDLQSRRALGEEVPASLEAELRAVAQQLDVLCDPIAWERELRRAPAIDTRLEQLPEATLLHLTTSLPGLTRVAQLLVQRREGGVLRGVHEEFRLEHARRVQQRAGDLRSQLRREVLGLSFLGHPFAGAGAIAAEPPPLARSVALEQFRRTHYPPRTLHVLVGGFEAAALRELLATAFASTALPPAAPAFRPPQRGAAAERQSSVTGRRDQPQAVTVGCFVPEGTNPMALAVLTYWLVGGPKGEVAQRLRGAGHPEVTVNGTAPFPHRQGGLLLLEVTDVPPQAGAPARVASVQSCLNELAAGDRPTAEEVAAASAHLRAQQAVVRSSGASLARELAIACAIDGVAPAAALEPLAVPSEAVQQLARRLLASDARTVVQVDFEQ
jgi:predicted Zn-dependent peptidase